MNFLMSRFYGFFKPINSKTIKSMNFSVIVDQYSQIVVDISGTIISAAAAGYLIIVQDDNHTLRVFGNIANLQLNRVTQGTAVNVTVFYF